MVGCPYGHRLIFMHDNAPSHSATAIISCLTTLGLRKTTFDDMAAFFSGPQPHLSSPKQSWNGGFTKKRYNFYWKMPFEIFFAFLSISYVYMFQTNDYKQNLIEFITLHWNFCSLAIKCDTPKTT